MVERSFDKNQTKTKQVDPLVLSVHHQKERGARVYFSYRDLKKIREVLGEDFFLLNQKKLEAYIDPVNETITISASKDYNSTSNQSLIGSSTTILESIPEQSDDEDIFAPTGLDFYIPIQGTGDRYWIAEVSVKGELAYYCIATTRAQLEREIHRKADMHFPELLDSDLVEIQDFSGYLVHSPVPGTIAGRTYNNIADKKLQDVEISASISLPNDADLTPLVDLGRGQIEGLTIRKRTLLAKYEVIAIGAKYARVDEATVMDYKNSLVWHLTTSNGDLFIDAISKKRLNID